MNTKIFFFSSRRRHTRCSRDWSSDVCSSDLHALSAHGHRDAREWLFIPDANGKPELATAPGERPQLAFNLSHTRGLVACVVAHDVDVGIDVERVGSGTDIIDLARRHFSSAELAELERCVGGARAARFTELWTLKESYVKATGAGILRGLDECAFTFGASSLRFNPADTAQADAWQFALFEVLDYRLAVAVRDPAQSLITLRIHEAVGDDRRIGIEARLLRMSRETGVAFGA